MAPRSMKMGTIPSPCPYDAAARHALQSAKSATACDLALRLMGGCLPDFAGWSGYPSIAALSISPGIDVIWPEADSGRLIDHLVGVGELTGYRFVWRQADGPARKPGYIEITRQSHLLIDKNRAQPIDTRRGTQRARNDRWCLALRHRFSDHPPNQFALVWNLETENEREGLADIGIADGYLIDEPRLEVRPDRGHEIHGIGPAKAAMHALTLLIAGVGDDDGTQGRRIAAGGERAEIDDDRRLWGDRLAFEVDRGERQRSRKSAERVVDEEATHIVLRQQRLDDACRQVAVQARQVDQIGAAIGGNDHVGLGGILADQSVAGARSSILGHASVLVVRIEQPKTERLGKVDGQEAARQEPRRNVSIAGFGCEAGRTFLRDGRKAVVGRDDNVGGGGKVKLVERLAQLLEIVVSVLDGGARGWAIDPGAQGVEAIAMAMLRPIRIARPVDQHERLVAGLEHRQHDLSRGVGEIFLLLDVCDGGPGGLKIADPVVLAAGWRRERQACGSQRGLDFFGQRNAGRAASGVIEQDCSFTGLLCVIEEGGRAPFSTVSSLR